MTATTSGFEHRLDRLEEQLPGVAASVLHGQRSIGNLVVSTAKAAARSVAGPVRAVVHSTNTALQTVLGTARRQVDDVANLTAVGARTTTGQAKAQVRLASEAVQTESGRARQRVGETVESAIHAVEDVIDRTAETADAVSTSVGPYEKWTRADLYAKAQDLDIDGRSSMSKQQLVRALRRHVE